MLPGEDFFFFPLNAGCVCRDVYVCAFGTLFIMLKKNTSSMYRNRRDSVKLGRVMEPSEQGGNCFKSITFMEISEFQKQGEDHYF